MNAIHMKIDGIHDAIDAVMLERGLEAVPNVLAVEVKTSRHEAVVQHKGTNVRALTRAIHELGYEASDPFA